MSGLPTVTLHLWGVDHVGPALWRMIADRRRVQRHPGLRFAKLLGTGSGDTFTVRDADPYRWAVLTVWDDETAARRFDGGPVAAAWDAIAHERLRVTMTPLSSRGTWSGSAPFGEPVPAKVLAGPVAAITRARLRPTRAASFWRAVPAVSADLRGSAGLRLSIGVGEAPVGLQGTFSLWDSAEALSDFAYRRSPHAAVVRRTAEAGWYAEELFARLRVLEVDGTFRGATP
jgi:heme-degrading monooxygenase HmoA